MWAHAEEAARSCSPRK